VAYKRGPVTLLENEAVTACADKTARQSSYACELVTYWRINEIDGAMMKSLAYVCRKLNRSSLYSLTSERVESYCPTRVDRFLSETLARSSSTLSALIIEDTEITIL